MSFLTTLKKFGNHIGAYKVHFCPEVKGQVSEKGKPLSNVRIDRVLNFSDGKCAEDFTYTDKNGSFLLPEINIRSNQPVVPLAEIFTSQAIIYPTIMKNIAFGVLDCQALNTERNMQKN